MASNDETTEKQTESVSLTINAPVKRAIETVSEPVSDQTGSEAKTEEGSQPLSKKAKTESDTATLQEPSKPPRVPGVAPIKEEYLNKDVGKDARSSRDDDVDDDAAEGRGGGGGGDDGGGGGGGKGRKGKKRGQNKDRDFGRSHDALRLCSSVAHSAEFSPRTCPRGDKCRSTHDLRQYLKEGRREDLETFGGQCPVFQAYGRCSSGWKCRFVKSHMKEVEHDDGRKELVLLENKPAEENGEKKDKDETDAEEDDSRPGVVNVVSAIEKINLTRRRTVLDKSESYIKWLNGEMDLIKQIYGNVQREAKEKNGDENKNENEPEKADDTTDEQKKEEEQRAIEELRAQFVDPPFLPSEKRKIYFGRETPTLAPLTTQGNLPFRRLCVELGCEVTYSEMALGMDMVTGKQPEWALMKAHTSETTPPRVDPTTTKTTVLDYDNSRDLKFGAQIAASQPWMAIKAAEAMTRLLPHLRVIDVNCGCPLDLVCRNGGGSGLLESHNKLERMVRGMNAVSGEVPITAKLRIGVKDNYPLAPRVIERLAFGGVEVRERLGAPGCAAITLHGRTRNQRYKKPADWGYIAECAALVKSFNEQRDVLTDTVREPDPRTFARGDAKMFFLGNGDCYSHVEYFDHIDHAGVDTVMIGRGALVKPWLFEEIVAGQYLDKSASERLAYLEKFARYAMDAWGTDEQGLGMARRFLLEHLSFTSRYVPIGLLEYLPPSLSDRPPSYRCRNELETLLASRNYKDWIKISEMFLGPAHPDFKFLPKHKIQQLR